jgi:DNA-binding NarL/FixJ family response regulator
VRVLLVDDHVLLRRSLALLLSLEPDLQVVGEAGDGHRAIELTRALMPDVVLMDISMPGMNGIEATRVIRAEAPGVTVIGLSMYERSEQAKPMLDAGAAAYVSKTDPPEALLAVIRTYQRPSPPPVVA